MVKTLGITALTACCLFLFSASLPAQDIGRETKVDSILASVNGEPVTLLDIILESGREEIRLASMFSGERLYAETTKLRKRIVEEIVTRKLVYDSYKAKPFPIEPQYIEDLVDSLAASMGDGSRESLSKKAKELGTSMEELREKAKEKIAVDILLLDFCDRQVYITPKEVFEHYRNNPKEWTKPAKVELLLLQIGRDGGRSGNDAQASCRKIKELLKGADTEAFKKAVRENSDSSNAENGGVLGAIDKDKLRPEFAKALADSKPGDIVGPVETPEGFYFIRVESISPAELIPFEDVSQEIRKKLETAAKAEKRAEYIEKLKSKALVRYYF